MSQNEPIIYVGRGQLAKYILPPVKMKDGTLIKDAFPLITANKKKNIGMIIDDPKETGYGYKVFRKNGEGQYSSPFIRKAEWRTGETRRSSFRARDLNNAERLKKVGFHVFRNRKDADKYRRKTFGTNMVICRVQYKGVIVSGYTNNYNEDLPTITVRYLTIIRELK